MSFSSRPDKTFGGDAYALSHRRTKLWILLKLRIRSISHWRIKRGEERDRWINRGKEKERERIIGIMHLVTLSHSGENFFRKLEKQLHKRMHFSLVYYVHRNEQLIQIVNKFTLCFVRKSNTTVYEEAFYRMHKRSTTVLLILWEKRKLFS